jgi:hypothetical protein
MTASPATQGAPVDHGRARRLLFVALAAVVLGLAIQGVLLAVRWSVFAPPGVAKAASDIMGGVTWSALVCTGVAAGAAVNRYRASVMGLCGLIAAPVAFAMAKGVQKGMAALSGADPDRLTPVVVQIATLKSLEYALLGIALSWLARRAGAGLARHAVVGLFFGLVFGAAMIGVELNHPPVPLPKLVTLIINELVFPIGCASILYAAGRLPGRAGRD